MEFIQMTSQNNIQSRIDELVARFQFFNDWKDRYQYLIDMGKKLPTFDANWQTEDKLIHGCQSQVWLHIQIDEQEKFHLFAKSDAAIVSGMIALLLKVYEEATAEEILHTPLDFLGKIGLLQHLSPSRSNGLYNMVKHIHATAKQKQQG
jgi:cysteine desulfuration protein SufE